MNSYRDVRNPVAPLRSHSSTHSDDITNVCFFRSGPDEVLLSASTDGLICTSNPNENDEDEATIDVGNWGCSISKAGIIGSKISSFDGPRIWAGSDMETFSLWNSEVRFFLKYSEEELKRHDPVGPAGRN